MEALAGVSLEIPAGGVGVVGPNGAGKSTLFAPLLVIHATTQSTYPRLAAALRAAPRRAYRNGSATGEWRCNALRARPVEGLRRTSRPGAGPADERLACLPRTEVDAVPRAQPAAGPAQALP